MSNSAIRDEYQRLTSMGFTPGEAVATIAFRCKRPFTSIEHVLGVSI